MDFQKLATESVRRTGSNPHVVAMYFASENAEIEKQANIFGNMARGAARAAGNVVGRFTPRGSLPQVSRWGRDTAELARRRASMDAPLPGAAPALSMRGNFAQGVRDATAARRTNWMAAAGRREVGRRAAAEAKRVDDVLTQPIRDRQAAAAARLERSRESAVARQSEAAPATPAPAAAAGVGGAPSATNPERGQLSNFMQRAYGVDTKGGVGQFGNDWWNRLTPEQRTNVGVTGLGGAALAGGVAMAASSRPRKQTTVVYR